MTYAQAVDITKHMNKHTDQELKQAVGLFRSIIATKGSFICVYERGRCEQLLMELDRRGIK